MEQWLREHEAGAIALDAADDLRALRSRFRVPLAKDIGGRGDGECVYLVGNSLGLQPVATRAAMEAELDDWARLGVEAHFKGAHPWFSAHEEVRGMLSRVVGALPREVVAMNSLTTNLHLMMVSFYRPTRERYKIVIEDTAFPSDSYAVQSQVEFHAPRAGFDASRAVVRLKPREGEATLRTADVLETLDRERDSVALVMLGGVNYLTGQLLEIGEITSFARARGVVVGWDLAHAAGNIDLRLHDDGPDFAAWCSYKYLNSGPGSIAGAFVHERHLHAGAGLPRFAGWWGNDPKERFRMGPEFRPVESADAWQLSNPPIFALTPLRVSLELFDRATMPALREKSKRLTGLLERLIDERNARGPGKPVGVLTPREHGQRGCQLSLVLPGDARRAFSALQARGIVCDFREPNVVRAAPVPLYSSFHDVWRFVVALDDALEGGAAGGGT
ncbi:MAG: kynureninase [Phycisphaerales bacterium]|nr:kynureninase [Phycisphaerales bacterium]